LRGGLPSRMTRGGSVFCGSVSTSKMRLMRSEGGINCQGWKLKKGWLGGLCEIGVSQTFWNTWRDFVVTKQVSSSIRTFISVLCSSISDKNFYSYCAPVNFSKPHILSHDGYPQVYSGTYHMFFPPFSSEYLHTKPAQLANPSFQCFKLLISRYAAGSALSLQFQRWMRLDA
jgi:hypothetical protein